MLRGLTSEDSGLDSSTVCNGFIRVDRLVRLLAVEEIGNELDDARNSCRSADENDFVDVSLVDLRIAKNFLNGLECGAEEILAKLLETGAREGRVEVNALKERVDLNRGLCSRRKGALSAFARSAETTQCTGVGGEICKERVSTMRVNWPRKS